MAPTHSRNSSFSQSSVGSGPSSGWVTDELSDGFSAPSTPFFTPGSTYSELQSDRSPSSMSSVLPSRLSPSQRKQARDVKAAAKYLAELEKSHKQAALPKLPKERTEKNQEASEARRSNKSTIVACPVPECGETYTRLTGLKDHLAKHFPMRRRTTLQCPYTGCSYKTDTKSSMTRHQNLKRHFKSITPEV
ncbi:hypothetical protein CPB83DRAFT_844923 [Crepidotus variabilis]|uniref:C2H2-type domain-containing protein n=1 Tax=Crepidotus variabilis TaxID=179855 RepID=A0A9P6EQ58_9AGAR|nr:hypothetical protein CPB83DRAFT_844923 [Crepidotus variabilis]